MRRATTHRACQAWLDNQFQSTLSMRRATGNTAGNVRLIKFQSTLSMRRATRKGMTDDHEPDISIHALHEESDSRYPS